MSNNSDYNKKFHSIFDLLPDVFKSDNNKSVLGNTFDRLLTKPEFKHIDGIVGIPDPLIDPSRQIIEPSSDRQAYQLQPMLYSKIGTVEHLATWKDILNELGRLGVDLTRNKEWSNIHKFNFVPPIDIDKLINYREYYWYNPSNFSDTPQYITIKNVCTAIESKVILYRQILDNNGENQAIVSLNSTNSEIGIANDLTSIFAIGFTFFVRNSTNSDINDSAFTVVSSTYDNLLNITIIVVSQSFVNDTTVNGVVSLIELLNIFEAERDLICNGNIGWGAGLWDDNQLGNTLWNVDLLTTITFLTLNDWITASNDPTLPFTNPAFIDIWYDTTNDQLKQWDGTLPFSFEPNWKIVVNSFSALVLLTEGIHSWDDVNTETELFPQNQWVDQNFWLHKSVVPNFSTARQAQIPIIEYSPFIEINEWALTSYDWKYRAQTFEDFVSVDKRPSIFELIDINSYDVNAVTRTISMDPSYGDLTNTFIPGYEFFIVNSTGSLYDVVSVTAGLGGIFVVSGDASNDYTSNILDPLKRPTIFKVKNSTAGLLDGDWTIASVTYAIGPNETTLTVIPTQFVPTNIFGSAQIFVTNNGKKTVENSFFRNTNTYSIANINSVSKQITVVGDIENNKDFSNYLFIEDNTSNVGVWTIVSKVFNGAITIVTVQETLNPGVPGGTVNPGTFKTEIVIVEELDTDDGSTGVEVANVSDGSQFTPTITSQGDAWTGYNNHWVFGGVKSTTPTNHQLENPYISLDDKPIQVVDSSYGALVTYALNDFDYTVNFQAQNFRSNIVGLQRFELHTALKNTVKKGNNGLRVYKQGINDNKPLRIFGTYTELTEFDITAAGDDQFVVAIDLDLPLEQFGLITITVGAVIFADIGFESIFIRTEEDNIIYSSNPTLGSGFNQLFEFDIINQVKTSTNQYINFDIYNVDGTPANRSSIIFAYKESAESDINANINKRIVVDGTDFEFDQKLLDIDNGPLLLYRDYSISHTLFSVNNFTTEIKFWTGVAWVDKIITSTHCLPFIIGEIEPISPFIEIGQIWYKSSTKELKQHDGINFVSIVFDAIDTDLGLKSIWVPGQNDEEYIPEYVDGERNSVTIGDPLGDWEIPDPLYYNVNHENRKCLKFSELFTHFKTIIDGQVVPPGFIGTAGQLFHILDPNYGIAGTIREYNESFDTLLSAIFVNNVTPISVLEFAQDQYEVSLISMRELFIRNAVTLMTDTTATIIATFDSYISDQIITQYELNDINALIYGDSTAHDATTGLGVNNFIATLPFFGLLKKKNPTHIIDSKLNINQILHHDGHRSNISIQPAIKDGLIRQILNTDDTRGNAGIKMGNIQSQYILIRPQNEVDFLTGYSSAEVASGKYWFETIGITKKLYRFNVISTGISQPADTFTNGLLWYDTATSTLRVKTGLSTWTPVTAIGDGLLGSAWIEIDIDIQIAKIILEVETRLYNAVPTIDPLKFDFPQLEIDESVLYQLYSKESFGDFAKEQENDTPFSQQGIFNNSDPFTWNYYHSNITTQPYTGSSTGINIGGAWQDLYEKIYGTPYPHVEPWALQGYTCKPSWWDATYAETNGTRRWIYNHGTTTGMWEQIRIGSIPVGEILPNGSISTGIAGEVTTYNFVSVMVDDIPQDGFNPDDILPPFYDHRPTFGLLYTGLIRSLMFEFGTHIVAPGSDFEFGNAGTFEWFWEKSSQRLYDDNKIAFRLEPLKYLHASFGINFIDVNKLQVNIDTSKVYSHTDTLFHGDIVNSMELFIANGLNQWYTNFNRFAGFDTSASDFRRLWINWNTPLTYQFASFVNTTALTIENKNFDIISEDFNVTLKKSLGIKDNWIDSLSITILKTPRVKNEYDTESEWRFSINSSSPIARRSCYYDVKNFQFQVDLVNNKGKLYTYKIIDADLLTNTFSIDGDWRHVFSTNSNCDISTTPIQFVTENSSNGVGPWTVSALSYDSILDRTIITIVELLTTSIVDGNIVANYRSMDWVTGQQIFIDSTKKLPAGLDVDTPYYIIKLSPTEFQLATHRVDAENNNPLTFQSIGTGDVMVGQVATTFKALSGERTDRNWRLFTIDESFIRAFTPPFELTGIQACVNFINGYAKYTEIDNWVYNFESAKADETTGRTKDWQLEIEKFINNIFGIQLSKFANKDTFSSTVDNTLDRFTFDQEVPVWGSGTKVTLSTTGTLPDPILNLVPYYIIRDLVDTTKYQLAVTRINATNGVFIPLTDDGLGSILIQEFTERVIFPKFEVNPFRNDIWYNTPQGIISNIITGSFPDIRTEQTTYDQYGRLIDIDDISILRQDKISRIFVRNEITNDVELQTRGFEDPDKFLHIGGLHIFLDGFEHVVFFDNYTSEGFLIYDPFIGLNTQRFNLVFNRQIDFNLRPNFGGTFLTSDNKLIDNIEAKTLNLQNAYDTYNVEETNPMTRFARETLGYEGNQDYLDDLGINKKSQFIFWRGMIQAKGSVRAANAFINSKQFVDASIDEYWTYKIAEYGDVKRKIFPELKLNIEDTLTNELRIEFTESSKEIIDVDLIGLAGVNFIKILYDFTNKLLPGSLINISGFEPLTSIIAIDLTGGAGFNFIKINDDFTSIFILGQTFEISGSFNSENDGTRTVTSSSFLAGETTIIIAEAMINSAPQFGNIIGATDGVFTVTSSSFSVDRTTIVIAEDLTVKRTGLLIGNISFVAEERFISIENTDDTRWFEYPNQQLELNKLGSEFYHNAEVTSVDINPGFTGTGNEFYITNVPQDDVIITHIVANIRVEFTNYTKINNRVIEFGLDGSTLDTVHIFTLNPAKTKHNTPKLIDYKSGVVITNTQIWDPARNHHYGIANRIIDIRNPLDPAEYNVTNIVQHGTVKEDTTIETVLDPWNNVQTGMIWLDTLTFGFQPYFDDKIYSDVFDRIKIWGAQAEWATPKIYTWVSSDVHPDAWNELATQQIGDITIDDSIIKSGSVESKIYNNITKNYESEIHNVFYYGIDQGPVYQLSEKVNLNTFPVGTSPNFLGLSCVVYQNDIKVGSAILEIGNVVDISNPTNGLNLNLKPHDILRFVQPPHDKIVDGERTLPTQVELDAGDYIVETPHTLIISKNEDGTDKNTYYFWVRDSEIKVKDSLSVKETSKQLIEMPQPYSIITQFEKEISKPFKSLTNTFPGISLPDRYTQFIIKGLGNKVNEDNRYKLRFTHDFTLRDDIDDNLSLKNTHEEWKIFREQQQFHIDRYLWNRATEALMGVTLTSIVSGALVSDPTFIPSLDKVLYDEVNFTDTQYGLRTGQTFVNKEIGITTLLFDLFNPDNDFSPVDINTFVQTKSFDTPVNIKIAMDEIYNTFGSEHVNRIFFLLLHDSFALKQNYPDLFKTSMISVHGVRQLLRNGVSV